MTVNLVSEVVTRDSRSYTNFYIVVKGVKVPIRPVHWSYNDLLKTAIDDASK